jgi:hypothetical protein
MTSLMLRLFITIAFILNSFLLYSQGFYYYEFATSSQSIIPNKISHIIVYDNRASDTIVGTIKYGLLNDRKELKFKDGLANSLLFFTNTQLDSMAINQDTLVLSIRRFKASENLDPNIERAIFDLQIDYYLLKNNNCNFVFTLDTFIEYKHFVDVTTHLFKNISNVVALNNIKAAKKAIYYTANNTKLSLLDLQQINDLENKTMPFVNSNNIPIGIYKCYSSLKKGVPEIKKYKYDDEGLINLDTNGFGKVITSKLYALNNGSNTYLLINNEWVKIYRENDGNYIYAPSKAVAAIHEYLIAQVLLGTIGLIILNKSLSGFAKFKISPSNGTLEYIKAITKAEWKQFNKAN